MHVLPSGFQKIRYYGFLNNRMKTQNLKLIFRLQGYQKFKRQYTDLSIAELLKAVWNFDIRICPGMWLRQHETGGRTMQNQAKQYFPLYCFYKASHWKVCEACPEIFFLLNFLHVSYFSPTNSSLLWKVEEYYPHIILG